MSTFFQLWHAFDCHSSQCPGFACHSSERCTFPRAPSLILSTPGLAGSSFSVYHMAGTSLSPMSTAASGSLSILWTPEGRDWVLISASLVPGTQLVLKEQPRTEPYSSTVPCCLSPKRCLINAVLRPPLVPLCACFYTLHLHLSFSQASTWTLIVANFNINFLMSILDLKAWLMGYFWRAEICNTYHC